MFTTKSTNFVFLLLILLTTLVSATDRLVGSGYYSTLQAAINDAASGDRILLMQNISENAIVNKGYITIQSYGTQKFSICGTAPYTPTLQVTQSNVSFNNVIFEIMDWLTIVQLNQGSDVTSFTNCVFRGKVNYAWGGIEMWDEGIKTLTVKKCQFDRVSDAIHMHDPDQWSYINENTFYSGSRVWIAPGAKNARIFFNKNYCFQPTSALETTWGCYGPDSYLTLEVGYNYFSQAMDYGDLYYPISVWAERSTLNLKYNTFLSCDSYAWNLQMGATLGLDIGNTINPPCMRP
jgi:hypothetical protein